MIAPMTDATFDGLRKIDKLDRARALRSQIEKAQRRDGRRATLTMRDGSKVTGWLCGGFAVLDIESGYGLGLVSILTEEGEMRDLPYLDVERCGPAETPSPSPERSLQAVLKAHAGMVEEAA